MRKIIVGLVLFALWIGAMSLFGPASTPSFADNGTSTGNRSFTLVTSQAIATGATYTTTPVVWDNPVNNVTCDIVLSNATATGAISFEGNVGSQVSGAYAYQNGNLASSLTLTANTLNTVFMSGKSIRTLRSRYALGSASTVTTTLTINCLGVQ